MPPLALRLRKLTPAWEIAFLAAAWLLLVLWVRACGIWPTNDCFHNYLWMIQYAISCLLDGTIPLWDPTAACGSPFALTYVLWGFFDPAFLLSVGAGKLLGLDPLQIYFCWIFLRLVPFLAGTFWLLKLQVRHSAIALFGAVLCAAMLLVTQFDDPNPFIGYIPLAAAAMVHFSRSVRAGRPNAASLLAAVACAGISLNLYNPVYAALILGILVLSACSADPRGAALFARGCLRLSPRLLAGALLLAALLLAPLLCLHRMYGRGEHFGAVRAHQASAYGRSLSAFAPDPLDYLQVDPSRSPAMPAGEIPQVALPFFRACGACGRRPAVLYLGILPMAGAILALAFRRRGPFLLYASSAAAFLFFMSRGSDGLLAWASSFLPPLRLLHQRHLLYPAFLFAGTLAGCAGLRLLLEPRFAARWVPRVRPWKGAAAGAALLLGLGLLAIPAGGPVAPDPERPPYRTADLAGPSILFAGSLALLAAAARRGAAPLACLAIAGIDAYAAIEQTAANLYRDPEGFVRSRTLRGKIPLEYRPYRQPLVSRHYGTGKHSAVRQLGLRTAFPAYWHADVGFSTVRLYELFGALTPEQIRPVFSLTRPIARLVPRVVEIPPGGDALAAVQALGADALAETVVLQKPGAGDPGVAAHARHGRRASRSGAPRAAPEARVRGEAGTPSPGLERAWSAPPLPAKSVWIGLDLSAASLAGSCFLGLFDAAVEVPVDRLQEVTQGVYHRRLYRIGFPLPSFLPSLPSSSLRKGRPAHPEHLLCPEFPCVTDLDGALTYFSATAHTQMRIDPDRGILLQWDGQPEEGGRSGPCLPRRLYYQEPPGPSDPRVRVKTFGANRVEIEAECDRPSALLYGDPYDRNWHATVDGESAPLWIANHAFQAVRLTPGRHRVAFEYRMSGFLAAIAGYFGALALSAVTAIACLRRAL